MESPADITGAMPEGPPAPRTWVLVAVVAAVAALYLFKDFGTLSRSARRLVPAAAETEPEPEPQPQPQPKPKPGSKPKPGRKPAAAFDKAYAATFAPGAADDACATVRTLFYARRLHTRAAGDARMRLPNDLAAARRLARRAEREDHAMLARIDEAKDRLGCRGLHVGPLGYPLRARDPATGRPRVRAYGDEIE